LPRGKVTGRKRFGQTLQEKNIELEAPASPRTVSLPV
jgi:hypothetical protein